MVNVIGFIALFSGVMSDTLQGLDPVLQAKYNGVLIGNLPVLKYKRNYGWMVGLPTLVTPLFLVLVYPVIYIVNRCSKEKG